MKNYLKVGFIGLLSGVLFYACSKDDDLNQTPFQPQTTPTNTTGPTICDITGASVVTPNTALVTAGSTVAYNYTNNTGASANIAWTVVTANPAGSITITGTGTTVNATYSSAFISGSISAYGTSGTANDCQSTLNITKN